MTKMAVHLGASLISITDPQLNGQDPRTQEFRDWQTAMTENVKNFGNKYDVLYIFDHGVPGSQEFGRTSLSQASWDFITSNVRPGGVVVMMGCRVANGPAGSQYLTSLAERSHRVNGSAPIVIGYTGDIFNASLTATGNQVSTVYSGAGMYTHSILKNYGN